MNGPYWSELLALAGRGLMIRTDSREVRPGEAFVLMPAAGERSDAYLADALARGAAWIAVEHDVLLPADTAARVVRLDDAPAALGELANAYFHTQEEAMQVVAVTGTNGKTTVAYLLEHLLTACGRKVGVLGTVAYRWPGVRLDSPLTTPGCWRLHELFAQMSQAGVDTVVMETSSHALHQKRVAGLEFDAAAFTNLTQDHMDYHHDFESYYQAKKLLFSAYPRSDKFCAINADDPYGGRLLLEIPESVGFSLKGEKGSGNRMVQGELTENSRRGLMLRMTFEGRCWQLESPLVGAHNASNLLAAQTVGLGLGLEAGDMQALSDFTGVPGRLERVDNAHGLDVFVDYAHTPDALENVQRALRDAGFPRLITVFGCGGNRDHAKRPLMGRSVVEHSDVAILTSDNPRREDPLAIMADVRPGMRGGAAEIHEEPDRYKAIRLAMSLAKPGDAVLVAGKGHETYQIVGDVKRHFSDVEAVRSAIKEVRG